MPSPFASAHRLLRFWLTSTRDHNGRLPNDLSIRIEWTEDGVTRAAVGSFMRESISWVYGSLVPDRIDDIAVDCCFDGGESGEVFGATFEGTQPLPEMYKAVESTCARCGSRNESIDHVSVDGCQHCCGHTTQIETETRGEPVGNQELHLYHRWSCSCGAAGAWGHSLWAKVSIWSAEQSAKLHVLNERAKEAA